MRDVPGDEAQRGDAMSADETRESIFQDLAAGSVTGDALRERVAALARVMGIPAVTLLLDLYVEARGIDTRLAIHAVLAEPIAEPRA